MFLVTVTLALIPSCSNLTPLTSTLAVMGLAMGTIDTIVNLSMIQLYGANVGPFLQVTLESHKAQGGPRSGTSTSGASVFVRQKSLDFIGGC